MRPYGSWPSPITADAGRRIGRRRSASASSTGRRRTTTLVVRARGPRRPGRVQLVRAARHRRPARATVDVLPEGFSARTRVHEYGGGAWWLARRHRSSSPTGATSASTGRPDTEPDVPAPWPLTPEPAEPHGAPLRRRRRSPPDGRWVICVRERHRRGRRTEARQRDRGGRGPVDGRRARRAGHRAPTSSPRPRVSPDGAPPVPGCSGTTRTCRGTAPSCGGRPRRPMPTAASTRPAAVVAGGRGESVIQPEWARPTVALVRVRPHRLVEPLPRSAADRVVRPSTPSRRRDRRRDRRARTGCSASRRYAFLPDGRVRRAPTRRRRRPPRRSSTPGRRPDRRADVDVARRFDRPRRRVGLTAAARHGRRRRPRPSRDGRAVVDLRPRGDADDRRRPPGPRPRASTRPGSPRPEPHRRARPTDGGTDPRRCFYPPTNPDARRPRRRAPRRCSCSSHGGPTVGGPAPAATSASSSGPRRGFAVVDVNYRGSTGYGRAYRERAATASGASSTSTTAWPWPATWPTQGEVDADRLAIRGGSAGGYTTLCALTFHDDFAAGASLYGVADLEALARDTHKFESRYLDSLVGPYPAEARPSTWSARRSTTSTGSTAR